MKAQVLHTYDDDLTASTWVEYKDVFGALLVLLALAASIRTGLAGR